MASRLLKRYQEEIAPALKTELGLSNPHQVPNLDKVVVNIGLGEATANPKLLDTAMAELTLITGQKPSVRRATKSVSNFRLREGQPIGCAVTLRGIRKWEFVERLFDIALPRVRDFSGVSPKAFDGRGNYTLGIRDQTIFPEVNYDDVERVTGMNITLVTTAQNDTEGRALLTHLGMPFQKQGN